MANKRATKIKGGRPPRNLDSIKILKFEVNTETFERLMTTIAYQAFKNGTTTTLTRYMEDIMIIPHIEAVESKMKKAVLA